MAKMVGVAFVEATAPAVKKSRRRKEAETTVNIDFSPFVEFGRTAHLPDLSQVRKFYVGSHGRPVDVAIVGERCSESVAPRPSVYNYLVTDAQAEVLVIGSKVVVDSPHGGYKIAVVRTAPEDATDSATKSIVDVVDDAAHLAEIARVNRIAELENRIEELRVEQAQRDADLELAAKNPEARAALHELDQLTGRVGTAAIDKSSLAGAQDMG